MKLTVVKEEVGYSDRREEYGVGETKDLLEKAKILNYEKWGEFETRSIEFLLKYDQYNVVILLQDFELAGRYIKIEAPTEKSLFSVLKTLKALKNDHVEKNAGVLLAEKMGLI